MKKIDLHVHSNISDGTLSPSDVVKLADHAGLSAIALTDHDTVAGIEEALSAADNTPLEVLPGVEISAGYRDRDIHILGLMIDHKNKELISALNHFQNERSRRNIKMAETLAGDGIDISIEKLLAQEEEGTVITRAHFAKYLAAHGYARDLKHALEKYLEIGGKYYVSREYISPEHAIQLIRNAGGVPVLAHPLLYKLARPELENLIKHLAEHGLLGLEAVYSSNTGHDEQDLRKLAQRYMLGISGGTDFHGANKPDLQIGTGRGNMVIGYEILEDLRKRKAKIAEPAI